MKRDQIWNLDPLHAAAHMGEIDYTSLNHVKEKYELFQKKVFVTYGTHMTQTAMSFFRIDNSNPKKPKTDRRYITAFTIISPDATELVRNIKGDITAWEEDGEQFISFGPYTIAVKNSNPNYEASYKLHNKPYPGDTETPVTTLNSITQDGLEYLDLT